MIAEVQSNEDLQVMCRICEKKTDATLIENHLVNCQQIFEARKQLHQLDVQIQKLAELAQNCFRTLNTKYQIHKSKQARYTNNENRGMRNSAPLKLNQPEDCASEDTGSRTNKVSCTVKSRFANLGTSLADDEPDEPEQKSVIQVVEENITGEDLERIMKQQIKLSKKIEQQKQGVKFAHSPSPEIKQISSPLSNGMGSPFSLDDNTEILKDLRLQLNSLSIITKYTEETLKTHHGTQSIQFDLKIQVELFNIKHTLQKEVQDLIKMTLKLIEEKVQCTQKISRLQKLISEEEKLENLTSPLRMKISKVETGNRRTSLGNSLQEHFEMFKNSSTGSKWLNKQNIISNFENTHQVQSKTFTEGVGKDCIFSKCLSESEDGGASSSESESEEVSDKEDKKNITKKSLEESFEMEDFVQQSKSNVISFKDLNQNLINMVDKCDFDNEKEQKVKGYYSDGDFKTTKLVKNKQLLNVTLQDFEFIQVLGVGAFGAVWLVSKKKTKDYYAMKVIDCRNKNMNEIQNLRAEKNVFEILEGDFVVKAYYSFIQDNCLLFLLEYMMGGDFSQVLFQYGRISESVAKFYLAELLLAIESLHKKGIIHRDLKPQNILLDAQGHLKLADFGLSEIALVQKIREGKDGINCSIDPEALPMNVSKRNIKTKCNIEFHLQKTTSKTSIQERTQSGKRQNRIIGTPDYIPPEVICGLSISNFSIDWWAFGVIAYEFLVGIPPFNDSSIPKVFENIINRFIEWPEIGSGEDMMSQDAYELINSLLEPQYHMRLGEKGADEVKSHKFFDGIDWNNIRNQEAPMIPIRDLDQLEEEESNITKKKNEEVKMKDRLQSVQVSHDGNLDDVANLTRVDLLAKISQKDAENVMKKRSIRKTIQQFL
ncbi:unnamed protein product (macronuclear) [Paramecium tetraurelia]|uniref:non-specific serine/threonine protein kinase n=1 Tax=Paramecium tetraurelia TaxID=5888 RepID=A0ECD4_PARTE|nr:uncharacterized protein GSPATT00025688001 [Paramecium tetraurelia]CAK92951.1 unnamed protein product [Paramecium tetraurelia]|eukprot:XP_001460348.1 hypothetical protein (macronuclear) [Paramecium tetraurelia strain d4-2]